MNRINDKGQWIPEPFSHWPVHRCGFINIDYTDCSKWFFSRRRYREHYGLHHILKLG